MSDEPALLAAILAHPDEDTPRLIYADWLDEHGQPERAEFIRLQCAPALDEAQEEREEELQERNRTKWLAGVPQFPQARWEFRRGFPEALAIEVPFLLERYDAFARARWLRFLTLFNVHTSAVRAFAAEPWNPRWVELELNEDPYFSDHPYDRAALVRAIAHCPQVRQLRRLHLWLFGWTPDMVAALTEAPNLDNLARLQIEGEGAHPLFAPLRAKFGDRLAVG